MAQVVFEALDYGYVQNGNVDTNYYTARNLTVGSNAGGVPIVGQQTTWSTPPYYRFYRGFVFFDCSTLPADAIIVSASIRFFNIAWNHADTKFNVILRSGDNAHIPVVVEDYDLTLYDGENFCEPTDAEALTYTLNDLGIAHINRTGITKFVLLSEEDINSSPPGGDEYLQYGVANPATITIAYFEPTEVPTVETINEACEDRQSTTLTAVGEITGTGDGYTYRGFEYYQYDEDGEYDSSMWAVREIGRFSTPCEYRMTLYGLKPLTCYWIRAYAGNVFGISYGDWVLCCTTAVPTDASYGIHEEDNSEPDSDGTYAGGNTISFYVRKVGGKWSKKYGPYHSDQVDIAVADVMIEGTGKYQVKFESGVLTGISTQVMCKLDIKARS